MVVVTVKGVTWQNQTLVVHVKHVLSFIPYLAAYKRYGILHQPGS